MHKMLIKSLMIVIVAFIGTNASLIYANHPAATLDANLANWTMLWIIPGFVCGLILGYDAIFAFFRAESRKIDMRFFGMGMTLLFVVLFPYLLSVFKIAIYGDVVKTLRVIQTAEFSALISLLVGYSFTQAFARQE